MPVDELESSGGTKCGERACVSKCLHGLRSATAWLLDGKPLLIGGDWPKWESVARPEHLFWRYSAEGVLLLVPRTALRGVAVICPDCKVRMVSSE